MLTKHQRLQRDRVRALGHRGPQVRHRILDRRVIARDTGIEQRQGAQRRQAARLALKLIPAAAIVLGTAKIGNAAIDRAVHRCGIHLGVDFGANDAQRENERQK